MAPDVMQLYVMLLKNNWKLLLIEDFLFKAPPHHVRLVLVNDSEILRLYLRDLDW